MTELLLEEQLAQLRAPPPENGFGLRLHNALLREANVMAVSVVTGTHAIPRWRQGGFRLRVALGVLIALTGSAAAMWTSDYVQKRTKDAGHATAEQPEAEVTLAPRVTHVHRSISAVAVPPAAQPQTPPETVPPITAAPQLSLPAQKPAAALSHSIEQSRNHDTIREVMPGTRRNVSRVETVTNARASQALGLLEIPHDPSASGPNPRASNAHQLQPRPPIEIDDIPEVADKNGKDRDAVSHGRGAEQREKKANDARELRRDNAARGLERAREARQKHQ